MRNKKLYVIGYDRDGEYVYGVDEVNKAMPCRPMARHEAKRELKYFGFNAVIYKLVPVAPEDL